MGLKPFDCARISRRSGSKECAEFLVLFEASLDASGELVASTEAANHARSEADDMKACFK